MFIKTKLRDQSQNAAIVRLRSVANEKGFKSLLQTNILYFVLKPFENKTVFTLTQSPKVSSLK